MLRYSKGTLNLCITYSFWLASHSQDPKAILLSDSNFTSYTHSRQSTSEYIIILGNGPNYWQPREQNSVSTSTTEPEYVALSEVLKQLIWASLILKELNVADQFLSKEGMLAYTDN